MDWLAAVFVALLGDEAVPTHPVWGLVNAALNALTLVVVAALYSRRR